MYDSQHIIQCFVYFSGGSRETQILKKIKVLRLTSYFVFLKAHHKLSITPDF